ncbi:MAG: IS3 family transposase [Synergistaceae bacterium]|nr:IS3 family transposase [Synergistaceae bacterium]
MGTMEEELKALRLENADLKMELDMLKKNSGLLHKTKKMIYRFISEQQDYSAAKWTKFLKVSRSGYCEWKKNRDEQERVTQVYAEKIRKIFEESGGRYGTERVCNELRKQGFKASFRRVHKIMNDQGLK